MVDAGPGGLSRIRKALAQAAGACPGTMAGKQNDWTARNEDTEIGNGDDDNQ